MKLNPALLSAHLPQQFSSQVRMARAMAIVGTALLEASAVLAGKPGKLSQNIFEDGPDGSQLTVKELIDEFLLAKARAGRGDRYLAEMRQVLANFNKGRASMPIDQVQVTDVEKWTQHNEWTNRTIRGYVADLRTLFNFAIRRGYLQRNPATAVELPPSDTHDRIYIHSPRQVQQVLETARKANMDVCRRLAIRYFAGVRSGEANRLTEENLKLDHGLIEVTAEKSKTRSRRLVTIHTNLKAWLDLGGTLRGISDHTILAVIRLAKVDWQKNVTRHSFVSYHLAQFQNAGKTALEAGHSEAILFRHYRALVTPDQAREFWAITPETLSPGK